MLSSNNPWRTKMIHPIVVISPAQSDDHNGDTRVIELAREWLSDDPPGMPTEIALAPISRIGQVRIDAAVGLDSSSLDVTATLAEEMRGIWLGTAWATSAHKLGEFINGAVAAAKSLPEAQRLSASLMSRQATQAINLLHFRLAGGAHPWEFDLAFPLFWDPTLDVEVRMSLNEAHKEILPGELAIELRDIDRKGAMAFASRDDDTSVYAARVADARELAQFGLTSLESIGVSSRREEQLDSGPDTHADRPVDVPALERVGIPGAEQLQALTSRVEKISAHLLTARDKYPDDCPEWLELDVAIKTMRLNLLPEPPDTVTISRAIARGLAVVPLLDADPAAVDVVDRVLKAAVDEDPDQAASQLRVTLQQLARRGTKGAGEVAIASWSGLLLGVSAFTTAAVVAGLASLTPLGRHVVEAVLSMFQRFPGG